MNEYQKRVIEVSGWIGNGDLPEWIVLWAKHQEGIAKVFDKVGGFKGWIECKDKKLSDTVQKELDDLASIYFEKTKDMYHQYRKDHPEEFKPRENE